MVAITPNLKFTVADDDGSPLAGGKVFFYTAGTSTKQNTYTDSTGATPNTNPVVLDARGEASVWLTATALYKIVAAHSTDTDPPSSPIWSLDNVPGDAALTALAASGGAALIGTTGGTVQAELDNRAKLAMTTVRNAFTRTPSGSIPTDTTDLFYGMANNVRATADTAVSTATPGAQIPSLVNVSHYFGGTAINDGRNSLSVHLHMTGSTNAANAYRYYAGVNVVADTSVNDGGVIGTPAGMLYGVGSCAWLKPGATYWRGAISYEGNVCVEATVPQPLVVASFVALPWPDHAVHGSLVDAGLWVSSGSATGFLNAIQIDDSGGSFAVPTTGTLIKASGAGTPTVDQGIDFAGVSITNYMLRGNGIIATTSTAQATSTATGAIRSTGGLGVAKDAYFGGLVVLKTYTVATLPTGVTGAEAFVSDANATTRLAIVAGGGANFLKVFYNGANWIIQ